ncbi:hypothetical protein FYK55_24470 [Roseiconus nitratireducens]|uniref:Uncharacterized protein n=1 Tax=Roseiconus nitratireducens TaxID=2605748 RepID=A0A5M6CYI8_9BACT|nr:hypothetical protein FYK55_24470 [Roseiconus nitratireducens]
MSFVVTKSPLRPSELWNGRENRVAAIDFPLSNAMSPRVRFIAWFGQPLSLRSVGTCLKSRRAIILSQSIQCRDTKRDTQKVERGNHWHASKTCRPNISWRRLTTTHHECPLRMSLEMRSSS